MSTTSLTRSAHLLVIRDGSIHTQQPASPAEIASLLQQWIEWHDRLQAQGKLRFRCPVEPESRSISRKLGMNGGRFRCEQLEPVVGYLLVDATNLEEATEIANGCPGLAHGFTVEIYRPSGRNDRCRIEP